MSPKVMANRLLARRRNFRYGTGAPDVASVTAAPGADRTGHLAVGPDSGVVARPLHLLRATLPLRRRPELRDTVIDKLGFLVRFWELKARHATLGEPLSAAEQVELLSLMQLVTGDFKMPPPGTCARPSNPLPAQLIGEGTILSVEVRYVCAAALLVASVKPMSIGERAIIRTADAVSGVEYALPCTRRLGPRRASLHHGARRRRHSRTVGLSGAQRACRRARPPRPVDWPAGAARDLSAHSEVRRRPAIGSPSG